MIQIKKTVGREKANHINFPWKIDFGGNNQFFTEKALIELFNELQKVVNGNDLLHIVSGSSIPPLPPPPLCRVITVGVGHLCNNCNSTMPRSGFLGLIGERLCDNKKCPNSKSQKNYR